MTTTLGLRVVADYHARLERLRAGTGTNVARAWDQLGGVGDAELAAFSERAAGLVTAAQRQTITLTDAYVARYLSVSIGHPVRPAGVTAPEVLMELRGGTPAVEVYARPVVTVRTALSEGRTLTQALAAGRARALGTAETDVMLAHRQAAVDVFQREPRVAGYERVLSGRSCDLCAIASTQRYHSDDLMPIHDHCDCGVVPIVGDASVGHVLNRDRYEELKSSGAIDRITAQRQRAAGSLDELVAVHDHGELGPVLTVAGDHFTGPAAVS